MSLDREVIYRALFTRLQGIPGLVTVSRRWRHWDDVLPPEQPALYLLHGDERQSQDRGLPPAWKLQPKIYLYTRHDGDPRSVPGTALNALITLVESALERQPSEGLGTPYGGANDWSTTLGGLCSWAKIDGLIATDEGLMGDQAVAVIPLEIMATG